MSGRKIIEGLKEAVEHAHNHQPDKDAVELKPCWSCGCDAKLLGGGLSQEPEFVWCRYCCAHAPLNTWQTRAAGLAAGVPEWQPIETAPKDGRELWLLHKDGDQAFLLKWSTHYSVFGLGGCWTDGFCTLCDKYDVTHWLDADPAAMLAAAPSPNKEGK